MSCLGPKFEHFSTNCYFTKKANRITNLQPRNFHTSPLFKQISILKFQDKICLENNLFVTKCLNNFSPSNFNTWFSFSSDQQNYETSSSTPGNLMKLLCKTNRFGNYSITVSAVDSWNKIRKQLKLCYLKIYSPMKLKPLSLIRFLNPINNLFYHAKNIAYMTLLVYKLLEE